MAKFNKRAVNYVAEKKKKVRVKRKLAGTIEKHRVGVKLQSGARTKKAQRRVAHMERVAGIKPESQAPSRRVSSDGMEMGEAADAQPAAKVTKAAQLRVQRKAAKAAKPVPMQE